MPSYDLREDPRQQVVDKVLAFWPEIVVAARAHGQDPATLAGLVCQESAGNPEAKRHEPNYRWDFGDDPHEHPTLPPGLSLAEDLELQKWSYGLCQLMGAVAREYGFAGHLEELLTDTATNLDLGARHLAKQMKRAKGDIRQALLFYNGGGNQLYDDKVLAWAKHFASRAADGGQELFQQPPQEQPKAEAAPTEGVAPAPFQVKENPMEKMLIGLAIRAFKAFIPNLIQKYCPEVKMVVDGLSPELKQMVPQAIQAARAAAEATPNDLDNIGVDLLEAAAGGLGLA
jgi:hypothetical protein